MKVENYSDKYFLDVVKLVQNFHAEAVSEYDADFDPNVIIETIQNADPQNGFLLIVDGKCEGLLYGTRFKSSINGSFIFQEVIWYVNPAFRSHGVHLLNEVTRILKLQDVNVMIMAVLENSKAVKLKRFYERLGFKPMETHYMRTL